MKIKMDKLTNLRFKIKFINYTLVSEFLAEFIGTLVLVTIGCCSIAQATLKSENDSETIDIIPISFGWGLGVFAGLVISSKITGHLNPAVTFSMVLLRKITLLQSIVFMAAQYLGAFIGAGIVYFVYLHAITNFDSGVRQVSGSKATAHIFATYPAKHIHPVAALIDQIIATGLLTLCIIAITDKRLNKNASQMFNPLIIGLLVGLLLLTFGYNCG